jgi:hypothetical protein
MERFAKAFSSAATKAARAATKTVRDYADGALPDEPSFTTALVTRIRDALDRNSTRGITWTARILSSHGPGTEEIQYGADVLGVLTLELPGFTITKGFVAQAKRQEPGCKLSASEWNRLKGQCDTMLAVTPESFVFVYALNGVFMIPAISVTGCATPQDLHTLHPKKTGQFYKEHFQCFVGDKRVQTINATALGDLRARTTLAITGKSEIQTNE